MKTEDQTTLDTDRVTVSAEGQQHDADRATADAAGLGGGQSGSGIVSALPAAQMDVPAQADLELVSRDAMQAAAVETSGAASNTDLAQAAIQANNQPAPANELEARVNTLTQRIAYLETQLNLAVSPSLSPTAQAQLMNMEAQINRVVSIVADHVPLLERVRNLFDKHWSGKI